MELDIKNIIDYLENRIIPNFSFKVDKIVNVEEITDQTYVNWIFKVVLKSGRKNITLYLRQSRNFVKKKPDMKLDEKRIEFEVKILNYLQDIISNVTPKVIFFDKENNVAVLEDIKEKRRLLVYELLKGRTHPEIGKIFGKIIANIHGRTLGISHKMVRGSKEANDKAIDFHLGMRLKPAQKLFPQETIKFLKLSRNSIKCLVLGDLASKNIFVDNKTIKFLDLERAFVGDPAFDLAFLFCHYLIEVPDKDINKSLEFISNFMIGYIETMRKYLEKNKVEALENRIIRFLGITILYRLFGFYLVVNAKRNEEFWINYARKCLTSESTSLIKMLKEIDFSI